MLLTGEAHSTRNQRQTILADLHLQAAKVADTASEWTAGTTSDGFKYFYDNKTVEAQFTMLGYMQDAGTGGCCWP